MRLFFYLLCVIVVGTVCANVIQAQDTVQTVQSDSSLAVLPSVSAMAQQESEQEYCTVGLSYSLTPSFGRLGIMYAMAYGHRIGEIFHGEVSLQHTSTHLHTAFFRSTSVQTRGDATVFVAPFGGILRHVYVGTGVSLLWSSRLSGSDARPTTRFYGEAWQFGVNTKIEYVVPLVERTSIGIRGQSQWTFQPFWLEVDADIDRIPPNIQNFVPPLLFWQNVSLGVFLRISF
jgi:hypothetical protein